MFDVLMALMKYFGNVHTDIASLSVIDLGYDNSTGTGIFMTD